MTLSEARDLAERLAAAVTGPDPARGHAVAAELERLDGRGWLLLDAAARRSSYRYGAAIAGVNGWSVIVEAERGGFGAVVASLHADGRLRERAALALATVGGDVATSALAVRLLDHVERVRAAAWAALRPRLDAGTAAVVLDVLLAGRDRQPAGQALTEVRDALLASVPAVDLVRALTSGGQRQVRRWAFELGRGRGALTLDDLLDTARGDPDQWLRATCARWLAETADGPRLAALLTASSVEARLEALTAVPDGDLDDDTLGGLLTDRSPRVRETARWRAKRRGIELAAFYRRRLADPGLTTRRRAAALDELAAVGDHPDLSTFAAHLSHDNARVRAAAVNGLFARAGAEPAVPLIVPLLHDPSARVSATAARTLAKHRAPPSVAEPLWVSSKLASRRAAWLLAREAGGWHRAEADLRAAADPDPRLARLGRAGLRAWLTTGATNAWQPLPSDQRARIADRLPAAGLDDASRRLLAFSAGIRPAPPPPRPEPEAGPGTTTRRRPWPRLVPRR
ncbi:hypothetical protein I6A84_21520 [Frankia sp. CNm7]|uniref:PBS lyase n=1 Tax=Frankia nepalensis TaxID=1836974 RepID=A0A937RBS5_9ACTN|nr:hypothetical protein [Frankia nepalensis]MBL7496557.1 hypothetical protein [Frankia nepalensis]MBL7508776.1 hypothetical protein [Frankia nepalensis]MBL7520597.1 hypothetical protein [Frankia nepalensis]MBL7627530.1 hypothetical protein [Frankia nepalensis]